MKSIPSPAVVAILLLAAPLFNPVHAVTVSGLQNFATQDNSDTSRYYTNLEAAALGYGINTLGDGFVVSNVYQSFFAGEYYLGDGDGGDFLTFSGLTAGLTYTVDYLVGNFSSTQRSVLGLVYDFEVGGIYDISFQTLAGPEAGVGVVGWSDGAGQAITWNTASYTFTATDETFSMFNFWDNLEISSTLVAAQALGVSTTDPQNEFAQVAIGLINVTAVPEPSSALLVGIVGMLTLLRRKRGN
ncbi:PEP-CTERM sorting domain-containing protein [Phragmitibacter flavus]|uniref:PEP-CTERM sorting domain-containing protein n=1 Tax=Phragmitibacter flavus TaxID=2576071 RepID=A0A5R8KJD8_9BACT|nr:PEP-CTERM sorting domain-containing protein [Phragmitibacter flavus]TLD72436.1 PEP-CTERM sorting domain-containing protein [Phragmitibacter flavus]